MNRIRLGPPCTVLVALACVAGTYLPGAAAFGIGGGLGALASPLTWLRLITWPFVHADTAHLVSNLMFLLLLSPGLEEKQGALEYLFCLVLTAVIIGFAHLTFGRNDTALVGASGWVFMMIILATFTSGPARRKCARPSRPTRCRSSRTCSAVRAASPSGSSAAAGARRPPAPRPPFPRPSPAFLFASNFA